MRKGMLALLGTALLCAGGMGYLLPSLLWREHDSALLLKAVEEYSFSQPLAPGPRLSGTFPAPPLVLWVWKPLTLWAETEIALATLGLGCTFLLFLVLLFRHPSPLLLLLWLDPLFLVSFTNSGATSLALPFLTLGVLLFFPPSPSLVRAFLSGFCFALSGALHGIFWLLYPSFLLLALPLSPLNPSPLPQEPRMRGGGRLAFLGFLGGVVPVFLLWIASQGWGQFLEHLKAYPHTHPFSLEFGRIPALLYGSFTLSASFFKGYGVPGLLAHLPELALLTLIAGRFWQVGNKPLLLLQILVLLAPTSLYLLSREPLHFSHIVGLRWLLLLALSYRGAPSPSLEKGGRPLRSFLPGELPVVLLFLLPWVSLSPFSLKPQGLARVPTAWENLLSREGGRVVRTVPNLTMREEVRRFVTSFPILVRERSRLFHGSLSPAFLETGWWFFREQERQGEGAPPPGSFPLEPSLPALYFLEPVPLPEWQELLFYHDAHLWVYRFPGGGIRGQLFIPYASSPVTAPPSPAVMIPFHHPTPPPLCPAQRCAYLLEFYTLDPLIWGKGHTNLTPKERLCAHILSQEGATTTLLASAAWGILIRCRGELPMHHPAPIPYPGLPVLLPYAGILEIRER